jgi:uncharacterized protein YgiM (DUF1202 family)
MSNPQSKVCRVFWKSLLLGSALFWLMGSASLLAAERYTVNSETIPLNVRRGPGTEHGILTRLLHGTPVVVQERSGLWVKITLPDGRTDGWVLERYLTPAPAAAPPAPDAPTQPPSSTTSTPTPVDQEEQQRFTRLQRKGVITAQRLEDRDTLRLTINPLLWQRLTPAEQQNFLQRARLVFGGMVVEIYTPDGNTFLARQLASGAFDVLPTSPSPPAPSTEAAPPTPPAAPASPGRRRSGQ